MSENDARMDAYRMVLKDLQKRKTAIEAAMASITSLMGENETTSCIPAVPPKRQESRRVESGAFADLTLTEAARQHLDVMKQPQSTAEIAEALKRGGYPTEARNFRSTVRSVLDRHAKTVGNIVKVQKNWELAEWARDGGKAGN